MKKTIKALIVITLCLPIRAQIKGYYPTVNGTLLEYDYYSVDYNEETQQPNWVIWEVIPKYYIEGLKNKKQIIQDKRINRSQNKYDITGTDIIMTPMCPPGDMQYSKQALNDTYYNTNHCPTSTNFIIWWEELEKEIRNVAISEEKIIVLAGPIMDGFTFRDIPIAKGFYKVLYSPKSNRMAVYTIANKPYVQITYLSVDSLEQITGIDFFEKIEPTLQNQLEKINKF